MSEIQVAMQRRAFFTTRSLAAYLAISPRTVKDMLARGVLPSYRVEGSRRIDPADVDAYLARCREQRGEERAA